MSIVDGRRVVLVTFAGRRDRMELLARYAEEALGRNLIDEWHVWNFARNDADDRWLNSRFPGLGRTPDNLVYYPAGTLGPESESTRQWTARVRSRNDVHIGLESRDPEAPSFEFVIGGWGNQRTALRRIDPPDFFVEDHENREHIHAPLAEVNTPGILSPRTFREIHVALDESNLTLTVDKAPLIRHGFHIPPGGYDVHVKTGFDSDAEWRLPALSDTREYLYHSTTGWRAGFVDAIHFYAARADHYADTVFLKCDDDIVYLQLETLEDFIRFRIRHPQYFLVTANVINNNICAHYQQQNGAVPRSLMELELPPGGFGGSLWESAAAASTLHHHFLDNRHLFEQLPATPIEWPGRLGMHFVAWMGTDLSYMSADTVDDERALSVRIPTYLQRGHCIYPRFLASHLSSGKQAGALDEHPILRRYRQLALENKLITPGELAGMNSEPSGSPPEPTPSGGTDPCGRAYSRPRPEPPDPSADPNVAIIVLNFNTAEMTNALANYLNTTLAYDRKRVYVIDNGSPTPPESATHIIPRNLGFVNGMYTGYLIASTEDEYDAFWLLNSDVRFDYGDTVLRELVDVLFSSADYAQIAPEHNSWHPFMERAESAASIRRQLEPTATLIKRSTIDALGFWDRDMSLGYGTDPDYGYRIRSAGLHSILTDRARIHHEQHQSMADFEDYHRRALAQEDAVLSMKYGNDWRRIIEEDH
ncbi:hypothetical protein [Nocardia sp. BMG111209]|uniref:hypothetical protein n=1 Tax=Nocardia sp. BMG111209 TaxID=1160137 RepID=UPI000360C11B|nr:hypothetical protein [Nocardia sp. BMG111209]